MRGKTFADLEKIRKTLKTSGGKYCFTRLSGRVIGVVSQDGLKEEIVQKTQEIDLPRQRGWREQAWQNRAGRVRR